MKRKLKMAAGALGVLLLGLVIWELGPALFPPKNKEVGIALGDKAPLDIAMRDSFGKPARLSAVHGPKGTVLLLVRSADWCPFCKLQLRTSEALKTPLEKRGYALASLSYDKPEILRKYAEMESLSYAMLSDPQSRFVDAVGLRDPQYPKGHFAYGVPRASVLVLARDGTVQAKFVSPNYKQRPSNAKVLEMVDGI